MAINPNNAYPAKTTAPSASYPYGGAQNVTTPGDGTGTPWIANIINDIFGFQQALLTEAGIVPSGSPDTATVSQYLQSLQAIFVSSSAIAGMMTTEDFLHIQDQKASGTGGGTFTSGAWQTRTLNTVLTNTISGASLASNVITLPAGTYIVEAKAPAGAVTAHKAKLYNVTDAVDIIIGTSERTAGTPVNSTQSFVSGKFTIAGTKNISLQHRCSATTTDGFGYACNFSVVEVYSDIKIWKVG